MSSEVKVFERVRESLDALDCRLPSEEFARRKKEILSLVERLGRPGVTPTGDVPPPLAKLSKREQQVMTMMLAGKRLKEIAATLDISVKTVTTHRSRLMRKLKVEDNLSLYRYGIRQGLISV